VHTALNVEKGMKRLKDMIGPLQDEDEDEIHEDDLITE
jgi:hypothetical protein